MLPRWQAGARRGSSISAGSGPTGRRRAAGRGAGRLRVGEPGARRQLSFRSAASVVAHTLSPRLRAGGQSDAAEAAASEKGGKGKAQTQGKRKVKKTKKGAAGAKKGGKKKAKAKGSTKGSTIVKKRKQLIKKLQRGRATGSLLGSTPTSTPSAPSKREEEGTKETPGRIMDTSPARSRLGSRVSAMTTPSFRPGSGAGGASGRASALKKKGGKKKGPGTRQLAQHLLSATADTALGAEVQILRAALATLTNTVVEEVDRLRQENASLKAALHASLQATHVLATDAREDARQALRQVERLSEGHGSWREDMAEMRAVVTMLKDSHLPLQERLQSVQKEIARLEGDLVKRFQAQGEEQRARRNHVDSVLDGLRGRFTDIDDAVDRQRREGQAVDRRRLEDMELVEKAVGSVQEQIRRLSERVTTGLRGLNTETRRLQAVSRKVTNDVSEVRTEAASARAAATAAASESSHRFESVSQVLRALTNAVAVGADGGTVPPSVVQPPRLPPRASFS